MTCSLQPVDVIRTWSNQTPPVNVATMALENAFWRCLVRAVPRLDLLPYRGSVSMR